MVRAVATTLSTGERAVQASRYAPPAETSSEMKIAAVRRTAKVETVSPAAS
jgi:hypothetical protein